jgi:RNA polymerase-binding transcription factor DksA
MIKDIQTLKKNLETEKEMLETSLSNVAVRNPDNPEDWEGKAEILDEEEADPNDVADNIEELEANDAVTAELEDRLEEINGALARIENGSFGICSICHKEIEEDRLKANPAAETCKEHMN